ncbi:MAG: hypothetical protein D3903_05630 [Candidatus Electrothrix sp. GM3_4]|nr:hypothetical protein [Candidatus Electrothrix sp. GM3_4]
MNTWMKSFRHCILNKMTTGLLVALAVIFISLFCAGTALASNHERHRDENKLYGIINSMPSSGFIGRWVVGGHEVEVTDKTRIKEKHGRAKIGRYVEIKGVRKNNKLIAYKIEVED